MVSHAKYFNVITICKEDVASIIGKIEARRLSRSSMLKIALDVKKLINEVVQIDIALKQVLKDMDYEVL